MSDKTIIYADSNAGIACYPAALKEYIKYAEHIPFINMSANNKSADIGKKVFDKVYNQLLTHFNVTDSMYKIVFTSSASESNCLALRSIAKSKRKMLLAEGKDELPHFIVSAYEHSSIIYCIEDMLLSNTIEVSYIPPDLKTGEILLANIKPLIQPNSCMIVVMVANNEIPVINNIKIIGEFAKTHGIICMSDCVQMMGKKRLKLDELNIDIATCTGYKLGSVVGVALCVIHKNLIDKLEMTGEINGSIQDNMRSGTINIAAIASFGRALVETYKNRQEKNEHISACREHFIDRMKKYYPVITYVDYLKEVEQKDDIVVVLFDHPNKNQINNACILLSISKISSGKSICNVMIKEYLNSKNCIISVGAACSTNSKLVSHVIKSMDLNPILKPGILRISVLDNIKIKEINEIVDLIHDAINIQIEK